MTIKALFFHSEQLPCDLEPLIKHCRQENFEVEDCGKAPNHTAIKALLPKTPFVLFMPAIEPDCLGIKLAQQATEENLPRVIVLYAPKMPSKEFLCLAFREGVDDIACLNADPQTLALKASRAKRILNARLNLDGAGTQQQQKIDSLHALCEQLEQTNAINQERLISLASTAAKIATGQLRLTETNPSLLIATTSESQASNAAKIAQQLGFTTHIAHTGKEAMIQIEKIQPQVILTDGTLSDMDAKTLAPAARQSLGDKPVIIIAWSSDPDAELKLLTPGSGIDDFVLKSSTNEGTSLLAAALLGGLRV